MLSSKILSVGSFDLRLSHLLIIGILAASFSVSFLIRSQPADYGFELNEFDPFFNYRATEYIVENGLSDYLNWHDTKSWYPAGRDVSATSQVTLHATAAFLYQIFGGNSSLYDFTIMFPVVFGSLTGIVVFALVRTIGGTSAGLFASLLFSISVPVLIRGQLGWFKSEPLGLFFSLLAIYLLLSGLGSQNKKISICKLASAGVFTTLGLSAWGGNQFFIIPIGIFFLSLPFLRKDHGFLLWAVPLFSISTVVSGFGFERVSSNFVFGLGGIALLTSTLFLVICILIQKKSSEKNKIRNGLVFLVALMVIAPVFLMSDPDGNVIPFPSHRYMNALNPFLTTTDPLVDSVSEHATTTMKQSFFFHSILMLFAGIGVWLLIKNAQSKSNLIKKDMISFSLIIGLVGVYTSSAFVRLEIFAGISIIVLSSLGLSLLVKAFSGKQNKQISVPSFVKISCFGGIIILLLVPMAYPIDGAIPSIFDTPPTILNGGTNFVHTTTSDWTDTLSWIKNNTPENSVVASWWDYGYWISTLAERTTMADNATLSTKAIENIARILLSAPNEAWNLLNDAGADYVVIFVAASQLSIMADDTQFYALGGGGDESKKHWFMRIGGFDETKFLHSDGLSATDYFWNNTMLGQMIPYSLLGYVHPHDLTQQSETYVEGFLGIYEKNVKLPADGDGPLRLVYASQGFEHDRPGAKYVILVYEVNKDFVP